MAFSHEQGFVFLWYLEAQSASWALTEQGQCGGGHRPNCARVWMPAGGGAEVTDRIVWRCSPRCMGKPDRPRKDCTYWLSAGSHGHIGGALLRSELYRLKGELVLARSASSTAEAENLLSSRPRCGSSPASQVPGTPCRHDLSHCGKRQGKRAEAASCWHRSTAGFTEAFDTADLQRGQGVAGMNSHDAQGANAAPRKSTGLGVIQDIQQA